MGIIDELLRSLARRVAECVAPGDTSQSVTARRSWDFSDAWFLESVAWIRDERADLSAVIGAGDAINRSIFNRDEIERAVARLRSAGLVSIANDEFRLTTEGNALYARSPKKYGYDNALWMETELNKAYSFDPDATWPLGQAAWQQAFADYETRFRAEYEELLREEGNDERP